MVDDKGAVIIVTDRVIRLYVQNNSILIAVFYSLRSYSTGNRYCESVSTYHHASIMAVVSVHAMMIHSTNVILTIQ